MSNLRKIWQMRSDLVEEVVHFLWVFLVVRERKDLYRVAQSGTYMEPVCKSHMGPILEAHMGSHIVTHMGALLVLYVLLAGEQARKHMWLLPKFG